MNYACTYYTSNSAVCIAVLKLFVHSPKTDRASYDKSKQYNAKSSERKALVYEAYRFAQRGLAIDERCGACHRVS